MAVANEPMTFTCPVATSNCTANYTAVAANTTWCFRNSPTFSNIWMFCLNQNEVTEKSGGDPASGIEDVVVQPSGKCFYTIRTYYGLKIRGYKLVAIAVHTIMYIRHVFKR